MDLQAGLVVAGRFVLERQLGKGGMGEVWSAKNSATGRRVALKVLHVEVAKSSHRERFFREARAAGALEHPNVCEVLDILEDSETPIMVLELLKGETLAERIARVKRLSPRAAARVGAQAASAVGAAHAAGIVHRDLKPANLFLEKNDHVRVLDFGIAKLSTTEEVADNLTATGSVLGTPAYMSPEQALGERDVDHRSDVWSLGIVLYECISGVLPTDAENMGQTIKKIVMRPIRPLRELVEDAPQELLELVGRMLERKRDRRVQDFREVLEVLSRVGEIECPPIESPARSSQPPPSDESGESEGPELATTMGASRAPRTRGGASRTITVLPKRRGVPPYVWPSGALLLGASTWFVLRDPSVPASTVAPLSARPKEGVSSAPASATIGATAAATAAATHSPAVTLATASAPPDEPTASARASASAKKAAPRESARPSASVATSTTPHTEALRDRR